MEKESCRYVPLNNEVNILVYRYFAIVGKNTNETVMRDYVKKNQGQDYET